MSQTTLVIRGSRSAWEQPGYESWDPAVGSEKVRIWEGLRDSVYALAYQLRVASIPYEVTHGYGLKSRVIAHDVVDAPVDNWEFIATEEEHDILNSYLTDSVTDGELGILRATIEADPSVSGMDASTTPSLTEPAMSLWRLIRAGVKTIKFAQPTVRWTRTVSNRWNQPSAITLAGKIFKRATIGAPGTVLFLMPPSSDEAAGAVNLKSGCVRGYRYKYPQAQQISRSRFQIVHEWEFGDFPAVLYGTLV